MNHSLVLPEDFDSYESLVEAKGWFSDAHLRVSGKDYRLTFYDPVRLAQQIESELREGPAFFESNLVVVKTVTRSAMEQAAERLARPGSVSLLVAE